MGGIRDGGLGGEQVLHESPTSIYLVCGRAHACVRGKMYPFGQMCQCRPARPLLCSSKRASADAAADVAAAASAVCRCAYVVQSVCSAK